jgi:hypothetical protein
MWSTREAMVFSVKLGLRRGLKLIRGMRRALADNEREVIAEAIVDDLERGNWKIEQGPDRQGHSRVMGSR